jgi:hypothetical protein
MLHNDNDDAQHPGCTLAYETTTAVMHWLWHGCWCWREGHIMLAWGCAATDNLGRLDSFLSIVCGMCSFLPPCFAMAGMQIAACSLPGRTLVFAEHLLCHQQYSRSWFIKHMSFSFSCLFLTGELM